jgi:hypothetical protein
MSPTDLLRSARIMLAEVEQFAAYASEQNAELESRHFVNDLRHEISRLDSVSSPHLFKMSGLSASSSTGLKC